MFIFSLSCSDLVVCCTSATITPIAAFKKEWIFGATLCSIAPFIAVSPLLRPFTISMIYSLAKFVELKSASQKIGKKFVCGPTPEVKNKNMSKFEKLNFEHQ
ncbi:unnamed protein product [Gongylonema pulchrum]|uniref:G_PROTEIN_RECEP_F1_2 domain-containing protein n=1 Tax=Gongylonema pulchrum TaxID=637853 RepID=A0A183EYR2_9BILA|nr:unnamed protein product [Gongylonema pulchrum]